MTGQPTHFDIIIIGSGPAGFTAAIYAARGGASTALFGGVAPGGQLLQTMEIENYPGFVNPVVGADLMQTMLKQAARLGTTVFTEEINEVALSDRPFRLIAGSGKVYTAGSVIIATGARARWLGMPSEQKYIGKGVSGCATCDGFFFRGKEVCVIGGGDSAAEDALFLTKFASRVYMVHRRDKLRATFRLQEKLRANPKIEIVYGHTPEEITGEAKVNGINIKNVKTGASRRLETTGIFIAIGHVPATSIFKGKLNLDESGYIVTDDKLATSVFGVFAAGDVMDTRYKQAIVAAGAGCKAAMEALLYLEEVKK
ncbi:MAG: thioredoxin-disulfide reductase [Elusimicrobia bacterium CG_4_10_14_0_2_um_filter_56_8]|nr:MAG: thioredoxin-disulfide reductase [Elusimicrobia bacterium CG1_02_56_21]PJA16025.1 MAG: thioredoxin-disulfide reductase [Elusimicrobia bacterium CG_4_10_14_0_2_um_filter_56_8]